MTTPSLEYLWTDIPETLASYRYEVITRDTIPVLIIRLRGSVSRHGDEVSRAREMLDALATTLEPAVDVAVLDVTQFTNANGDEAANLTGVFSGTFCLWVSSISPEEQDELGRRRWDLPPSGRLAPSVEEAITRVVERRRAGNFSYGHNDGRWEDRGLMLHNERVTSLYHRNLLIERHIQGYGPKPQPRRVLWPNEDRTGETHEALRRQARLVFVDGEIIEVDFSPYQTQRPAPENWPEIIADIPTLEALCLNNVPATDQQILGVLTRFPKLRELRIQKTNVTEHLIKAIAEGAGPALEQIYRWGTAIPTSARQTLSERRPPVRVA